MITAVFGTHAAQRLAMDSVAWAAGLFEGEGSVMVLRIEGGRYLQPKAKINMVDRDIVIRFYQVVGFGSVIAEPQRNPAHKLQWRWHAGTYERVQALVAMFWPWLGERRREQSRRALLAMQDYYRVRGAARP